MSDVLAVEVSTGGLVTQTHVKLDMTMYVCNPAFHDTMWRQRMLRTWSQPAWQTQQRTKRDIVSNKVEGKDAHPSFLSAPEGTVLHICANTPAHNHAHKDTTREIICFSIDCTVWTELWRIH